MKAKSVLAILAIIHLCNGLPANKDVKEDLKKIFSVDLKMPELNSGVALWPNSDHVHEHEFPSLTPEEENVIKEFINKLGSMVMKRLVGDKSNKFNLEGDIAKPMDDENVEDLSLDDQEETFTPMEDKIELARKKRSIAFDNDIEPPSQEIQAQSDIQLHFPDNKPNTTPKKILLPSGVAVNVEPGQSVTIGANGEIMTAPSSTKASVKGHPVGPPTTVTMTDPSADRKTMSTAEKPGPVQNVPINPKVSGLVALLQKTIADGYFRRPMDKDLPIDQIQVKLKNGTRYFYELSRDVKGVDHTLVGDCDPQSDPTCATPQDNGHNAGQIHVHLSNGSTINYSFKKANQLDPISLDAKERALKIKMYVTAATTLDDILFRKPGSDEIMKDKIHFEEVFLEELGKKLREANMLIPKDGDNPSGIVGNENPIPGQPNMEPGESLSSAVEHYMGLLNSEETRNHGTVGSPVAMGDPVNVGAIAGYALGGTCGIVVFLGVLFMSAHFIETCDAKAGRLPAC